MPVGELKEGEKEEGELTYVKHLCTRAIWSTSQHYKGGLIITFISQVKRLRHREVLFAQVNKVCFPG